MSRPQFGAETRVVRPGIVLVTFTGDLDRETVDEAAAHLATATADHPEHLILDLSRVIFMGSDGISLLITAHRNKNGVNGRLHIVGIGGNRHVLRPLQLMNLTDMLCVEDDLETALADLSV